MHHYGSQLKSRYCATARAAPLTWGMLLAALTTHCWRQVIFGVRRIVWGTMTLFVLASASPAVAQTNIELYSRPGCPHCAEAHEALTELVQQQPGTTLAEYDVVADPAALARLQERAARAGVSAV